MSPRYVVARIVNEWWEDSEHVLDLPDAEHIHVHIHPDGTITAVPMKRVVDCTPEDIPEARWFWVEVDAPTGGDA